MIPINYVRVSLSSPRPRIGRWTMQIPCPCRKLVTVLEGNWDGDTYSFSSHALTHDTHVKKDIKHKCIHMLVTAIHRISCERYSDFQMYK